ncbi:MAG: hypothetical protein A2161_01805 [Candidatus Schekmanbacteria bacterium RBG_13_48_7]|uniref:Transport permease protein n=1 Tax=Candidatus Schekmanbacteria bacterium RBG_13_48_7 TaxID=1817878 RepID=A0A1F7RRH5_9BACT|nr:MAG: hypothetical protein A2161_01805 [Candidatus Schekmanbacteria bacterium RBG_13_48_7]
MKWLNAKSLRLLFVFVSQELRGRYVGSTMGIFWNLINPLVMISLYTLVFQVFLKMQTPDHPSYAAFIFCGLLPWMAISESLMRSTTTILENANLVKKVVFPTEILILNIVISSFIHELIGLVLFIILLLILGTPPGLASFLILFVFIIQIIFSIGLGFFFSTLNVYIRDVTPLLQAFLTLWFFLTPIVYPMDKIPAEYATYCRLNPLYSLIKMYRSLLLKNQVMQLQDLLIFSAYALGMFLIGLKYFQSNKLEFSDYI